MDRDDLVAINVMAFAVMALSAAFAFGYLPLWGLMVGGFLSMYGFLVWTEHNLWR